MLSPLDTSETLQCVECSPVLEAEAGLIVDSALLQPSQGGFAHLAVTNPTGLPQWVGQGTLLGEATNAVVEETDAPCPENWNAEVFHDHVPGGQPEPATTNACDQELSGLRCIDACLSEEARKEKLLELLPEMERMDTMGGEQLHQFLIAHHDAFNYEREETDVLQFGINTGDATPKRLPARRMPLVMCQD